MTDGFCHFFFFWLTTAAARWAGVATKDCSIRSLEGANKLLLGATCWRVLK